MIRYDRQYRRHYDDETGEWCAPPAQDDGLLSPGQAIAAILMLPIVIVWVCNQYGIDLLALMGLPK